MISNNRKKKGGSESRHTFLDALSVSINEQNWAPPLSAWCSQNAARIFCLATLSADFRVMMTCTRRKNLFSTKMCT